MGYFYERDAMVKRVAEVRKDREKVSCDGRAMEEGMKVVKTIEPKLGLCVCVCVCVYTAILQNNIF